jgi:two-component system CheB/CheR fusion protein
MTRAEVGIRLVVVDDNEDNVEMLAALLEEHGCQVRTAHDGARALELVEQELPDVVLLDIGLPDVDGLAVAMEMRRRFGAAFRIIALTGFSGAEHRERARQAGIDAFFAKPFQLRKLEKLLGTRLLRPSP